MLVVHRAGSCRRPTAESTVPLAHRDRATPPRRVTALFGRVLVGTLLASATALACAQGAGMSTASPRAGQSAGNSGRVWSTNELSRPPVVVVPNPGVVAGTPAPVPPPGVANGVVTSRPDAVLGWGGLPPPAYGAPGYPGAPVYPPGTTMYGGVVTPPGYAGQPYPNTVPPGYGAPYGTPGVVPPPMIHPGAGGFVVPPGGGVYRYRPPGR